MEGAVHRRGWNKKVHVGTTLLVCMFVPTLALLEPVEGVQCDSRDYPNGNGICCDKCLPGYKLVEMCQRVNSRSICAPCDDDQYTSEMNWFNKCRSCKSCKKQNEVEVSKCERYRNTVCRCVKGYYKDEIDSETYDCRKCRKCGPGEKEKQKCTPTTNTECECAENYYKVNNKCQSCENCTTECEHHCASFPKLVAKDEAPDYGKKHVANIIGGVAAVVLLSLLAVVVVTHMVTKWSTKKKLLKPFLQTAEASPDSCEVVLIHSEEPSTSISVMAADPSSLGELEQPSNLPDCVPFEIKIPDLIYMVLDLVPVIEVKQLVRCLGVKDREIEQVEVDYRSCREAHYQMLRVWAEKGSRAGGMLHWPLLQELLEELKKMNLGRAVEELETKYGIP